MTYCPLQRDETALQNHAENLERQTVDGEPRVHLFMQRRDQRIRQVVDRINRRSKRFNPVIEIIGGERGEVRWIPIVAARVLGVTIGR